MQFVPWDLSPTYSFKKIFIYLFMRHSIRAVLFIQERPREADTQAETEAGSRQGARCGTRSPVSRIAPWAEGRRSSAEPPGRPWKVFLRRPAGLARSPVHATGLRGLHTYPHIYTYLGVRRRTVPDLPGKLGRDELYGGLRWRGSGPRVLLKPLGKIC